MWKNTVEASDPVFPWQCTLVRRWHNLAICTRLRKLCNFPPPPPPLLLFLSLSLSLSLILSVRHFLEDDYCWCNKIQPASKSQWQIHKKQEWAEWRCSVCVCVVITSAALSQTLLHWRGRSLSVLGLVHWIRTDRGDKEMKVWRDARRRRRKRRSEFGTEEKWGCCLSGTGGGGMVAKLQRERIDAVFSN